VCRAVANARKGIDITSSVICKNSEIVEFSIEDLMNSLMEDFSARKTLLAF
jgi:hypothetical protein